MCPALRPPRRASGSVGHAPAPPISLTGAPIAAQARRTGTDPLLAQVVVFDGAAVPMPEHWHAWSVALAREGVHTMRTGALSPRQAEQARRAGLECVQELALLDRAAPFDTPRPARRSRRATRHDMPALATVDAAAFGPVWCLDAAMLADIRRATPLHRARVIDQHGVVGFLISGRAGRHGYIQRLAVQPDHQRHGIASALLQDSMRWLARARVQRAFVNTHVDNAAALALYQRHGFQVMPEVLRVFEGPTMS